MTTNHDEISDIFATTGEKNVSGHDSLPDHVSAVSVFIKNIRGIRKQYLIIMVIVNV